MDDLISFVAKCFVTSIIDVAMSRFTEHTEYYDELYEVMRGLINRPNHSTKQMERSWESNTQKL